MALLQRQVKNIVIFANSEKPLKRELITGRIELDADIPPLFGETDPAMPNNTVFPNDKEELSNLKTSLYEASQGGGLAMTTGTYTTVPNQWFGVPSYEVNVLWVYNALVQNWVPELKSSVSEKITNLPEHELGPLRHFPNYDTVLQNPLDPVSLTAQQVNLLADMFCWGICQEPDLFRQWLT